MSTQRLQFVVLLSFGLISSSHLNGAVAQNVLPLDAYSQLVQLLPVPSPVTTPHGHAELISAQLRLRHSASGLAQLGIRHSEHPATIETAHQASAKAVMAEPHNVNHSLDYASVRLRQVRAFLQKHKNGLTAPAQQQALSMIRDARDHSKRAILLASPSEERVHSKATLQIAYGHLVQSLVTPDRHQHAEAARATLQDVVHNIHPDGTSAVEMRLAHQYLGAAAAGVPLETELPKAVMHFRAAANASGAGHDEWYALGVLLREAHQPIQAIKAFRTAAEKQPTKQSQDELEKLLRRHAAVYP